MALDKTKLERIAGGIKQVFHYDTPDALATVKASGYFNLATDELKQNDVIMVVGATGGTRTLDFLVVASATGAATVTTIQHSLA